MKNSLAGCLLVVALSPSSAIAGLIAWDQTQVQFVQIENDPNASNFGSVTKLGSPFDGANNNPINFLDSLVYDSVDRRYYGISSAPGFDSLYRIDPVTGQGDLRGSTGLLGNFLGMAHNPSTDTLFAATATGLFTVDKSNGTSTFVGEFIPAAPAFSVTFHGLTFDSSTSTLYGIGHVNGAFRLHSIDVTTGAATSVGGPLSGTFNSLAYDTEFDRLYTILRNGPTGNELYELDRAGGAATLVAPGLGASNQSSFTGLTDGTAVPEPSSFLLLFGILPLKSGRRRRECAW